MLRRIVRIVGGLIALAVAAAVGLWIWKPWVPPIELADPASDGRRISGPRILGNYFPGAGSGRRPAILLLGGSEGGLSEAVARQARALARAGYPVLQLSYFRSPGQPKALEDVPLETFATGLDWLKLQPEVDPARLAVVGGSKGAEAALLIAVRRPELRAVVAMMPSSVAWAGFSWETFGGKSSSWSEGGKPVPFLPMGREFSRDISAVYRKGLETLPQHPAAAVPVERITAPVMLICGEADTLWPSCPMARQLAERAARAGRPDVILLAYPDAGHGVGGVPWPAGDKRIDGLAAMGGSPAGNNAARADAWPRMLAFLKESLGA